MRAVFSILAGAVALVACVTPRPAASPATVAAYVAEAQRLAGQDLKALVVLCEPAPAARAEQGAIDRLVTQQIARTPPEPPPMTNRSTSNSAMVSPVFKPARSRARVRDQISLPRFFISARNWPLMVSANCCAHWFI